MEKKFQELSKIKGKLIVSFILWLILIIVFVAPVGLAIKNAFEVEGDQRWEVLFTSIGTNIINPLESIVRCLTGEANGYFWATLWRFTIVYLFAVTIGITKALPKHEYDGIENGSSDWCTNGEQYSILNNKEGIILAEKITYQ